MRLCKDGRRDDIMCNKWGFGGNAPSKLRPVLKARGASMRATRAGGTAKSLLYISYNMGYTKTKVVLLDCAITKGGIRLHKEKRNNGITKRNNRTT